MDGDLSRDRPEERQRSVESAVLAIVIERHPEALPRSELLGEMVSSADGRSRVAEVEDAVEGLVGVGLLAGDQSLLPTPAALRISELDVGL